MRSMSKDVTLESPVASATPMSSSRLGEDAPRTTDSRQPRSAVMSDPAKARAGSAGRIPAGANTLKAATRSPAPALMPSTPGSAMSLRDTPWSRQPATARPMPTSIEVSTRGSRSSTRV